MEGAGIVQDVRYESLKDAQLAHKELRAGDEADEEEATDAHELTDSGWQPLDGSLCPSFPFPLLALQYPGPAENRYRSSRKLFDPPAGQPVFRDRILSRFMRRFLLKGGGPIRTGFFFDEDSGAVFGEETAVEQLASHMQNTLALPLGEDSDSEDDSRPVPASSSKKTDAARFVERSSSSDLGRVLSEMPSWPLSSEADEDWRPNEDSSYALLLSQHTFTQKLSLSIVMVVLSSFDLMTSVQLIISLCADERFSDLRNSSEGKCLVYAIVCLMPLYVVFWILTAYLRANAQVRSDIDYVGDLVWPTGAPTDSCQERPEGDRLASNRTVRCALSYLNLYIIPYIVRDVVQLCHPRKGAMKFGAFSHRGKMPRVFALGYGNKVMFHFEETAGMLSGLPNIVCVKLPLLAVKVYIIVSLQFNLLLLVSIMLTFIINGAKVFSMAQHIQAARHYKRWLVNKTSESASAKTVREKLLRKHFFFTESATEPGRLQDPGAMGWFRMLFGESDIEHVRAPMGYLERWARPSPENEPHKPGGGKLQRTKTILALRPGEDIGSRIVFSSGIPRIPTQVVDSIQMVHPLTGKVVNEFWYTADGQISYEMPGNQGNCCKAWMGQESETEDDLEWMYARLMTVSSYSVELAWCLFRACWTAFYNIGMFNLLVQIVTSEELKSHLDQWFLGLFLVSRLMWFYFSFRRAQRFIVLDWKHKADFVVNVGLAGRITLMLSTMVVETFIFPRMIKDIVSLMHPDKRCHPFVAFGGKLYGPRAYIVGFSTKDMYTTESLHGIVSQLPVLLADLALTASLCWTLRAKIGLFAFYKLHGGKAEFDQHRWLWCRLMTWLVIISSIIHFMNKARIFFRYWTSRQRFRPWLKQKLRQSSLPTEIRQALKKEWQAYFGNLDQVLVSGPLSP